MPVCLAQLDGIDLSYSPGPPRPNRLQQLILENLFRLNSPATCLMVLATGLGKTYLSMFAVEHYFDPARDVLLFLVNSSFIKKQAYQKYADYFESKYPAVAGPLCRDVSPADGRINIGGARMIFCLFQSLHYIPSDIISQVTILVIDEVHHVLARTYLNKIRQFGGLKLKLGLTATLTHQNDPNGCKIRQLFNNNLVCDIPWYVAKQLQMFPEVRYYEFTEQLSFTGCQLTDTYEAAKNSVLEQCSALLNQRYISNIIQKNLVIKQRLNVRDMAQNFYLFNLFDGGRYRKSIVFMTCVADVELFAECLAIYNHFTTYVVHYKMTLQQQMLNIAKFRQTADNSCLVTVSMVTEGYDLPDVDCILMGRPTDSERLFVQQMGRCLRKSGAKSTVYVLDMCGNLRQRWARLCTEQGYREVERQMREFWYVKNVK